MTNITIDCNTKPFVGYIKSLKHLVDFGELTLNLSELDFELARIDTDYSTAPTSELLVTLYPSDSLLSFVATALAGDADV